MDTLLKAEIRSDRVTKSDLKQMRDHGKVPAVVYGKKVPSTPIVIDEKQLAAVLRRNPHSIIEMDIPEVGKHPVMISGMQRDSIQRHLLHIDFHQINMDEPVRTTVALEFTGESPAQKEGGVLTAVLHEVEVRCLPNHLPTAIAVDISGLQLGESFLAKDLRLPPEIELKTDENAVLATILVPQKASEEAEAMAEEANADNAGKAVEPAAETADQS
ncbi:50S ribosomal protein L25 [Paenibacillus flagellatus]|uniref:Large ribosomal subunit protein bL25 n=1 Tax=Paenibacillus flagellatus TaxID=2211139 RepID=A0A2V5JUP1_9BACL|nr:50S ribosomal protein L25 [Paenibacillus flagellatus]PYI50218.1 50S ribosomal protein L25 [Paenibacillus flagellatus]